MRIPIAMMLAATVALSSVPAAAQDNQAAPSANAAAPAPADANAAAAVTPADNMAATTEMPPPDETAVANDAYAPPPASGRGRTFPWGLLGLLGLAGLISRRER